MNATVIGVLSTLLLFLGCATTPHADVPSTPQELVAMTPLHPLRVGTNYVIYKRFHCDDSR